MKIKIKNKIIFTILVILIVTAILVITLLFNNKNNSLNTNVSGNEVELEDNNNKESISVINLNSNLRSIAVSMDNTVAARPQTGISRAYLLYEFVVEGGITRFLAVFKPNDTFNIGPVRSARHYFLDYVMENDAVFVHYGQSPRAKKDIASLKINNINGMYLTFPYFWRQSGYTAPSNALTSTTQINSQIFKKYNSTSQNISLFNYTTKDIEVDKNNIANKVIAKYPSYTTSYEYDSNLDLYKKFANNTPHLDKATNKQLMFKNIITMDINNFALQGIDGGKGRQDISNIGKGTGKYITGGKSYDITWEKSSRSSKTIYKYVSNNKDIVLRDGNTIVQVVQNSQKVAIN